jgi:tetratricopeptide (TPR) repeat protein
MKQGKYEEALENFEIASRLRPNDIMAFSNYINALIALERFDDAAEKVRLLRESELSDEQKNPYLLPLYGQVSYGFAKKGETTKAIENARKALEIDSTSPDQRANLGLLLYQDRKPDEALAELLTALNANPRQADLQLSVGRIYLEQGKEEKAFEYFQNALNIDPDNKTAREYINKRKSPQ